MDITITNIVSEAYIMLYKYNSFALLKRSFINIRINFV